MENLSSQLLNIMNTYPNESSDYRIARYLLEQLEQAKSITSGDLSKACHCSKSTITRFCERLGLKDFYELKTLFYIVSHSQTSKYQQLNDPISFFDDLKILTEEIKDTVNDDQIDQFCDDIYHYQQIYLLGSMQSNHIALSFQHDLYALRKIVDCKIGIPDQIKCLKNTTANDLVIIFSNSGLFIDRLKIDLGDVKGKIYLLTQHNQTTHTKHCHLIDLNVTKHYASDSLALRILATYIIDRFIYKFLQEK